ncbi:DUF3592 domain-containing protein [Caenimonas sedimenti]|nr:DUF3592 domain-containing protein [Caenimonas sedimenti]
MLLAFAAAAGAAEPPTARFIEPPRQVVAGQAFDLRFELHNPGEAVNYSRLQFDLPPGFLLAAPAGPDCVARFSPQDRQLVYEGPLEPGQRSPCRVRLVVAPDTSTHASLQVRVFTPPERHAGDVVPLEIGQPVAPAAVTLGGFGITRAGLVVMGLLALGGLWMLAQHLRARTGRGARAQRGFEQGLPLVVVFCLGFLAYFGSMAWDDARTLQAWQTARCDVLDANVRHESAGGSSRAAPRNPATEKVHKPVFSLRYDVNGRSMQSIGFSTESRLSYTAGEVAEVLDDFQRAGSVPCWYDPEVPGRVMVLRGFGGAYFFALIPLGVLALLAWAVGPRRRRTRT